MKFHFVTIVWGEEYTELYLKIVIPNQLSPRNIHCFKGHESVYKIYTTKKDSEKIRSSSACRKLGQIMPIEIIVMDDAESGNKYDLISEYNKHAIAAAGKEGAALIFLPPDQIYSDGSFERFLKLALEGKRAVMVAAIRVVKETLMPLLMDKYVTGEGSLDISSRELVKLTLSHLHPIAKSLIWDSPKIMAWPSHLYFMVQNEGLVVRCFHPFPVLVNPHSMNTSFQGTLDSDYLMSACPNFEEIYYVDDSDEVFAVELDPLSMFPDVRLRKPRPSWVAKWAKYHTDKYQRAFFERKLRYHCVDISSKWAEAEKASDDVAKRVFSWLRFEPLLFSPKGGLNRIIKALNSLAQKVRAKKSD